MLVQYYPNREVSISMRRQVSVRPEPSRSRHEHKIQGVPPSLLPLDLASQPSQARRRKSFRRRKISKSARHRILKHAALLSPENKSRQVFLTGTLPGGTDSALAEFCRLAAYLVKIFQTYLPRSLGLSGGDLKYCWVWEQQKRGALHLHCVLELPDRTFVKQVVQGWGALWARILRVVAKKARCDIFARKRGGTWAEKPEVWQSDCQVVKKRVDKYLSKYVGKGEGADPRYFPPRWYGISSNLRAQMSDWIIQNTVVIPFVAAPEVEAGALGEYVSGCLSEKMNGRVGSRKSWSEPNSFWVYFYLREDCDFRDVVMTVYSSLEAFGDIDGRVSSGDKLYKDNEVAMKRLRLIMRREWPNWFYYDVIGRMPESSRIKFVNDEVMEKTDFIDLDMAFGYTAMVGYGNDALEYAWVKECKLILEEIIGQKRKKGVLSIFGT